METPDTPLSFLNNIRSGGKINKEEYEKLVETLAHVANGDTSVEFEGDETLGELIADVCDRIDEADDSVSEKRVRQVMDDFQNAVKKTAEGDYTQRVDIDSDLDTLSELGDEFNQMVSEVEQTTALLRDFAGEVADSSETVTGSTKDVRKASEQVTASIQEISEGAEEQSEVLDTTLQEMENLSATIEEITSSSKQVSRLAKETAEISHEGREDAQQAIEGLGEIENESEQAVTEMERLTEEIQQIDELVDFIRGVAEQTNMLAINAGIEAARAGEAGQGFAVVAEEVKGLADETADAAEEIETSLNELQEQATETSGTVEGTRSRIRDNRDVIEDTVESLDEIATLTKKTSNGVQEIRDTSEKQSESTQEVVELVSSAASVSQEATEEAKNVAAAAEEQTSSMNMVMDRLEELNEHADWLRDTLGMFRLNDDLDTDGAIDTKMTPMDSKTVDSPGVTESETTSENELETQFGSAIHSGDDSFETGVEVAEKAIQNMGVDRVDFAQVFASPKYDYNELLSGIQTIIGEDAELIGCSSAGEFSDDETSSESVALAVAASDTIKFYTGLGRNLSEDVSAAIDDAISAFPGEVPGYPHLSAINLHDGLTGKGERIALVTQRKLGREITFAGGSAGDDLALEETFVFHNGEVETDAVVMALVASKNPSILTANHGHTAISDEMTVTKSEEGTIYEIDGEPAFDKWKDAVRDEVKETHGVDVDTLEPGSDTLAELLTMYEIGIPTGDVGTDYKIRWPGLTEETSGPLHFVVGVSEGETVQVMKSPKEEQIESALVTAQQANEKGAADTAGAFIYDCVCRSSILGDDFDTAVAAIDNELDVPFIGFETYGELCMERGESSGFHNTTSVIMALPK